MYTDVSEQPDAFVMWEAAGAHLSAYTSRKFLSSVPLSLYPYNLFLNVCYFPISFSVFTTAFKELLLPKPFEHFFFSHSLTTLNNTRWTAFHRVPCYVISTISFAVFLITLLSLGLQHYYLQYICIALLVASSLWRMMSIIWHYSNEDWAVNAQNRVTPPSKA